MILYIIGSALIGTTSISFFKMTSIILLNINNSYQQYETYIFLFLGIFTLAYWIYRLNYGLKIFESSSTISLFQISWITFGVIHGGIVFQEFNHCHSLQQIIVLCFCFINICIGIVCITFENKTISSRVTTDVATNVTNNPV